MEMCNKRIFNFVEVVAGGVVANTKSHAKEKVHVVVARDKTHVDMVSRW